MVKKQMVCKSKRGEIACSLSFSLETFVRALSSQVCLFALQSVSPLVSQPLPPICGSLWFQTHLPFFDLLSLLSSLFVLSLCWQENKVGLFVQLVPATSLILWTLSDRSFVTPFRQQRTVSGILKCSCQTHHIPLEIVWSQSTYSHYVDFTSLTIFRVWQGRRQCRARQLPRRERWSIFSSANIYQAMMKLTIHFLLPTFINQ